MPLTETLHLNSYKSLQPDYTAYIARAYFTSLVLQNHSSDAISIALKHPDDFLASAGARWTNGLWFFSLISSLLVALFAILAKQWLEEYSSRMRAPVASPRSWAWRHLVFNRGLQRYHLETVISALPIMLHGSLVLFIAGLILFLWTLDRIVAGLVLAITGGAMLLYLGATIAPLWIGTFPTMTPLLRQVYTLSHTTYGAIWRLRNPGSAYEVPIAPFDLGASIFDPAWMDAQVICTMVSALPAEEDICVALQAIGSLDPQAHPVPSDRETFHGGADKGLERLAAPLHTQWLQLAVQTHFERFIESTFDLCDVSLWLRTAAFVNANLTIANWRIDQWMKSPTHDVGLLSAFQLYKEDTVFTVAELPRSDHVSPDELESLPFLASNILILTSRRIDTMSLHICTVLFTMIAPYMTANPSKEQERYLKVIPLLLQRIEDIADRNKLAENSYMPVPYIHMRHSAAFGAFRALNIFGLLLSQDSSMIKSLRCAQPIEHAICAAFYLMKWAQYNVGWQDRCRALAFLATPAFSKYEWPEPCLKTVVKIFVSDYFRPQDNSSLSPDLVARILHATIVQCRGSGRGQKLRYTKTDAGRFSTLLLAIRTLRSVWSQFPLLTCAEHEEMLVGAGSIEAATYSRLLGWLHSFTDRTSETDGAAETVSTWNLVRDIVPLGQPLVREAVTQLCIIHRSDPTVDTEPMFTQLLRDTHNKPDHTGLTADCTFGEDGVFETFKADLTIAQHAKEVSPKWWAAAAEQMRSMSAPRAQKSDAEFATLAEFADKVEAIGPCTNCRQGNIFEVPRAEVLATPVDVTALRGEEEGVEWPKPSKMHWMPNVRRRFRGEQQGIV